MNLPTKGRCKSATDFGGEEQRMQPFVRACPLFASSYNDLLSVLDVDARTRGRSDATTGDVVNGT